MFTVRATSSSRSGWTVELHVDDVHALTTVTDQLLIVPLEDLATQGVRIHPSLLGLSVQLDCSSPQRLGMLSVDAATSQLPDTDSFEYSNQARSVLALPWAQSSLTALVFGLTGVIGMTLRSSDHDFWWLAIILAGAVTSLAFWLTLRFFIRKSSQTIIRQPSRHEHDTLSTESGHRQTQHRLYRKPPTKSTRRNRSTTSGQGPRRRRADV